MQFNPAFFIEIAASVNIRQQILRLAIQNNGIGCRYGQDLMEFMFYVASKMAKTFGFIENKSLQ